MAKNLSPSVHKNSPQAPPGIIKTNIKIILSRLTAIENLLQKTNDHAYRQTNKPLTFKEACAYLGYAPSYLYKLTYRNVIPHYKPTGKMIFFSKNEIDEWIFRSKSCKTEDARCKADTESCSTVLTTSDPNQVEMFGKKEDPSTGSGHKIVIEFPLKSRRKK